MKRAKQRKIRQPGISRTTNLFWSSPAPMHFDGDLVSLMSDAWIQVIVDQKVRDLEVQMDEDLFQKTKARIKRETHYLIDLMPRLY